MEVPRLVRLDGAPSRRYLGPKRELLVLFPAGDLHFDQRHPHVIELAVQTLRMTDDKFMAGDIGGPPRDLSFVILSFVIVER